MQPPPPAHGRVWTMPYMTQQVCATYTTNTPTTRLVKELRPLHMAPPAPGPSAAPTSAPPGPPRSRGPRRPPGALPAAPAAAAHARAAARRRHQRRGGTNAPRAAGRRPPRILLPPSGRPVAPGFAVRRPLPGPVPSAGSARAARPPGKRSPADANHARTHAPVRSASHAADVPCPRRPPGVPRGGPGAGASACGGRGFREGRGKGWCSGW